MPALDANRVAIAFNGHAPGYKRNAPVSAGLVSYVFGSGGAALGRVSGSSSFDLYAKGRRRHSLRSPATGDLRQSRRRR
jgi:hypothetical protein